MTPNQTALTSPQSTTTGQSVSRRARALASTALLGVVAALTVGCAGSGGTGPAEAPSAPGAVAASDTETAIGQAVQPSSQVDNTATAIEVLEQSYENNDIAEILWLTYDGGLVALEETGGKNPQIEAINRDIRQTVFDPWEAGRGEELDWVDRFVEIRSYPFTSEEYLQIVTTSVAYPNNGSAGALFSWVFDRRANDWIQPEDVYADAGLSGAALLAAVAAAFAEDGDDGSVADVEPSGFVYIRGSDGWVPQFLLTVAGVDKEGGAWSEFFSYQLSDQSGDPATPSLTKLNRGLLFDPAAPDVMDPPLLYGGPVADSGMWIDLPPGAATEQTGAGTDDAGNDWAEYIAEDGALVVSIRRVAVEATLDSEEMAGQVLERAEGSDPATWLLDEEESQRVAEEYGYPVVVYRFDSGANEDLRRHVGVYVPTGEGGFVADFAITADLWDQIYPRAREWMTTLDLTDIPLWPVRRISRRHRSARKERVSTLASLNTSIDSIVSSHDHHREPDI
ncbi:MAG: hypothetical protein LBK59_02255 [Bifidobacteriaceae bacterium]|jgi:hypothetical protein|nr:hypothetical protein [Bifidobacteriaceae bacterium]